MVHSRGTHIQGEAHKAGQWRQNVRASTICTNLRTHCGTSLSWLQSDSTQTIDHIQKCSRQKFQCSRRPSYSTTLFFYQWRHWSYAKFNSAFLNGPMYFFRWNYYRFWDKFSYLQHKVILVTQSMKIVEKSFSFLFISYDTHNNTHR